VGAGRREAVPFAGNIRKLARKNKNFREVLQTGAHGQITLMSLEPGDDIGLEVHKGMDQILVVVEGRARATLNSKTTTLGADDLLFVPSGTKHNVRNVGRRPLKLYSVYAPPAHLDGTVHRTKDEALEAETVAGEGP
jgi:mannose-6-phosphate isomerase-like protein (cupin superfamily)